jgi:hypothetical protein
LFCLLLLQSLQTCSSQVVTCLSFFLQLVTLEEKQSFSGAFFPRATTGEGEGQRQIFFERRGESVRERERAWGSSFHMLELLSLEITLLQGFEV